MDDLQMSQCCCSVIKVSFEYTKYLRHTNRLKNDSSNETPCRSRGKFAPPVYTEISRGKFLFLRLWTRYWSDRSEISYTWPGDINASIDVKKMSGRHNVVTLWRHLYLFRRFSGHGGPIYGLIALKFDTYTDKV